MAFANRDRITSSALKIFRQFRQAPSKNFGCLKKSLYTLKPLLIQILMFGYIFAFHLPRIMVEYLGTGGNYSFLTGALEATYGEDKAHEYKRPESLASSLGPGVIEVESSTPRYSDGSEPESYGPSVAERAASSRSAWWHMTGYYRDGVAYERWNKSLELIADLYNIAASKSGPTSPSGRRASSASSGLFKEQYKGSLIAPTYILWGENDQAITKQVCLDGIGDYLGKESEVTLLPRSGHWTPVEKESRAAWATLLKYYLDGQPGDRESLTDVIKEAYPGAVSLVRKERRRSSGSGK
jgi:hypothetical protein